MILVWTLLPLAATPPLPFQEPEPVTEEPQDPLLPLSIPAGYQYTPGGRRDPFVNPVPPRQLS